MLSSSLIIFAGPTQCFDNRVNFQFADSPNERINIEIDRHLIWMETVHDPRIETGNYLRTPKDGRLGENLMQMH